MRPYGLARPTVPDFGWVWTHGLSARSLTRRCASASRAAAGFVRCNSSHSWREIVWASADAAPPSPAREPPPAIPARLLSDRRSGSFAGSPAGGSAVSTVGRSYSAAQFTTASAVTSPEGFCDTKRSACFGEYPESRNISRTCWVLNCDSNSPTRFWEASSAFLSSAMPSLPLSSLKFQLLSLSVRTATTPRFAVSADPDVGAGLFTLRGCFFLPPPGGALEV